MLLSYSIFIIEFIIIAAQKKKLCRFLSIALWNFDKTP